MLARVLGIVIFIGLGILLFQSYGYRYFLDYVRSNASVSMVVGRPNAPINILAYIDYASSTSKQLDAKFTSVLSADTNVNILYRPVPNTSQSSEFLARLAIAANENGHFMEVHNILLRSGDNVNEQQLSAALRRVGSNYEDIKSIAYSATVSKEIDSIKKEVLMLNIKTLPTYYVEHVKIEGTSQTPDRIISTIKKIKTNRI